MSSSSNAKSKRILHVFIKEPIVGQVKQSLAQEMGEDHALYIYKAEVSTFLEQLIGLQNSHLRFFFTPSDAGDAIRFWLLPLLRGGISPSSEPDQFIFQPEQAAEEITIDFIACEPSASYSEHLSRLTKLSIEQDYQTIGFASTNAPESGARWINMAMMLSEKNPEEIILGTNTNGSAYLHITQAHRANQDKPTRNLPILRKIKTQQDWHLALDSAIGAKLKKAYQHYSSEG